MKPIFNTKTEKRLTSIWQEIHNNSFKTELSDIEFSRNSFKKNKIEGKKDFVKRDFVLIQPQLLVQLKRNEQLLVIRIIDELKMNNCLWFCDYRSEKGRLERAVLTLRKKDILFETPLKSLHIVNPNFLCRGEIRTVIATTMNLIRTFKGVPDSGLVKNLTSVKKIDVDLYLQATL